MSFDSLIRQAGVGKVAEYEGYYEGTTRLDSLGVSLPPAVRVLEMAAPFPKMAVDVLAEVLNPEGYILSGDSETPKLLRRWWAANNLDTQVKLGITEALVQGSSYFIVGPGKRNTPRVTVHRPIGCAVSYDHMGDVAEGLRRYKMGEQRFASYYLPGETRYYEYSTGMWRQRGETVETGASTPAMRPLINKARLGDVNGRSEIAEVAKMTDAGSRSLTNLQVAQELLAMPTRYLFGDGLEALKDQAGNPIDKIAAYFGRFLTGPAGAEAGQIPGADLTSIINSYKLYAQIVSAITGIPPQMLGISTDNPSSAEAMRVAKDRLIARAEVKQSMFGDTLEEIAILQLEMEDKLPENVESLEMQWRDPALASVSAKSANLLQAHSQGVVGGETAREGLQLTPEQRARENDRGVTDNRVREQMGA